MLPLSKPALATFSLFYAVGYWNNYTSALLYINDSDKWPLQIMLRQIIMLANGAIDGSEFDELATPSSGRKYPDGSYCIWNTSNFDLISVFAKVFYQRSYCWSCEGMKV